MHGRRFLTTTLLLHAVTLAPGALPTLNARASPDPEGQRSQREEVIDVELLVEGRPRLRLAFPSVEAPSSPPPEARAAVHELEQTLRSDLEATGIFEIQGPEVLSVLELTGDRTTDFEQYRSLQNEVILLAEIKVAGSRLILEGRIYDLQNGRSILGKRYRGAFNLARRIAHTFTDEIVLYFTGRRGIALTTLAFASNRDGQGIKEIYLMDYDGLRQRAISGHKSLSLSPAWSPTGEGLAYVSYFDAPPGLYFVDLATGRKKPIVNDASHNTSPSISPDGKRVAFSRSVSGNPEIFLSDLEGQSLQRLTTSAGIDTNPAWSPTGREIAFTSSRAGSPQIYVMDAEGTNVRRVTFEGEYNDGAVWHPSGTRVAYASRRKGGTSFDIALLDLVTLEARLLTDGEGSNEAPAFSPDGRRIAFESTRKGARQIFVMDLNGGNVVQLTHEGENYAPAWSSSPK